MAASVSPLGHCHLGSMAGSLLLFLATLLLLQLALSDSGGQLGAVDPLEIVHEGKCGDDESRVALVKEIESTKALLSALDQSLLEKDTSLKEKDKTISALQAELEKKDGGAEDSLKAAQLKLEELAAMVAKLEGELKKKEHELNIFKDRVESLELAEAGHSSRYKKLEQISSEQQKRIDMAEHALRVAEAAMQRLQALADAKEQELHQVLQNWLPPWAKSYLAQVEAFTATHWVTHGKPLLNTFVDKVSTKGSRLQEWSKPHFDTLRKHIEQRWSPVVKQNWETVTVTIAPHVETAKTKTIKGYEASKDFLLEYLVKAQGIIEPYVEATREVSKPYVERVAVIGRPYFKSVQVVMKPYTKKVVRSYTKFLTSATKYHHKLQGLVHGHLKKHQFSAALVNKELVWFLASALLVLPVLGILLLFSSASMSKKPLKPVKGSGSHVHRKRRSKQADK
eukprot:c5849_g1_i1 orf=47-1405(+)